MREEQIFHQALEQAADQRAVFLDSACGADVELRERVAVLLRAQASPGSFLQSPAPGVGISPTIDQPLAEKPGTQIGPYKLLQQIGEGGMGVVYMAEQSEPVQRKVALKVIKPGMDSRQVIARFEAERQALAMMDHVNIARVLDAGTTGVRCQDSGVRNQESAGLTPDPCLLTPGSGRPYFVMELVKGVPITQYCDEHHLTPRQRLELLLPVCQAIQHAHQKGIIHRDIKPTNILVAEYDQQVVPKVIDFGVAKATSQPLTEKTMFTGFGQLVGTLEYMSPEQAKLNQLDIDTRSDIYSLGVLMYELLTGGTPFDKVRLRSAGWDEMLRIIREEEPLKPSTKLSCSETLPSVAANRSMERSRLSRTIRGELDWIVMKALEKDRNRRYETATGFARDLQRYLANEPVQACPPSAGYRLRKFVRRNRGPVLAASLVLLALMAGISGTTWGMIRAEQARRDAVAAQAAEAERAAGERRAKEEAQRRLAQLETGTEILASLFQDLDPIVAEKAGVTSRNLLSRRLGEVAPQLEGEAVGDPLVVARLQHLVGISLRELRHLEKAEAVLVKACRTRERLLGADDLDTVATKHHLAALYREQGKYAPAETLFKEVLAIRTARLGADDLETLNTKHHLAWLYYAQKKYTLVETLCKEVVPIRTLKLGADNLETVATKHLLAVQYGEQSKYDLAEPLFQQVLAIRTAKLGADHQDTLSAKIRLVRLYRSQSKYALAEPLLAEIAAIHTAKLGADDRDTLHSQSELAGLYRDWGKYDLAEPLYKQILAVRITKQGGDDMGTLYSQYNLATVYRDMKKLEQAISLLEDTLKRCKATKHPATLEVQADLGASYRDARRFADAIPLLEEVHRAGRKDLAWVGTTLLTSYVRAGRSTEAVALAKDQERAAREQFPADSLELTAALVPLGQALIEAEAHADAEPLYKEVLAIRIARLGANDSDTILPRDGLAQIYRSLKKPDQSIPLLEASLELRRAQLGPDHGEILARQVTLGASYCEAGRFGEGIALIEEVRHKGSSDPHPAWVRSLLLTAYVQAGKTAEATSLVAERVQEARQSYAADCPPLAVVLADNGKILLDAKAYADAERLLLEAQGGLKQSEGESGRLRNVVEWLVELYEAWDKPDEAAKWRKELEAALAEERTEKQGLEVPSAAPRQPVSAK
ncbi:MAG: tetratricopeptide repeat protein [Pirellulaceae bacterium]